MHPTFEELALQIRDHGLRIDHCGHRFHRPYEDLLVEKYERHRQNIASGSLSADVEKTLRSMLDAPFADDHAHFLLPEPQCHYCGDMPKVFFEDDKPALKMAWGNIEGKERVLATSHFKDLGYYYLDRCAFEHPRFVAELQFEHDDLIITNFFRHKEDVPDSEEFSVNHLLGRYRTMQAYAKKDVGYGQTGNISFSVYVSPTRDDVVLTTTCDTWNEEARTAMSGYQHCGEVVCDMWRYEMMTFDNYMCSCKPDPELLRNAVRVDIEPGRYVLEHYYCLPEFQQYLPMHARLRRKAE